MIIDNDNDGDPLADIKRRKRIEWGRRGGKAGSRADKRKAILKAWSNPDPSKRPGRKKGSSPWKKGLPKRIQAAANEMEANYKALLEELKKI